MLGDAHISKITLTSNSRLHYGQTTKHKEYFYFFFITNLNLFVLNIIPVSSTNLDKINNVIYYSFYYATSLF